jgi:hypothetical protein
VDDCVDGRCRCVAGRWACDYTTCKAWRAEAGVEPADAGREICDAAWAMPQWCNQLVGPLDASDDRTNTVLCAFGTQCAACQGALGFYCCPVCP